MAKSRYTGETGKTVKAKKVDALPKNTRVVDLTAKPEGDSPKQVGKNISLKANRPASAGLRSPKKGELKRGKTSVKLTKKRTPKRNIPIVNRNAKTGRAEARGPLTEVQLGPKLGEATGEDLLKIKSAATEENTRRFTPISMPRGEVVKTPIFIDAKKPKGNQAKEYLKGFGAPVHNASRHIWATMDHLEAMRRSAIGSQEYNDHHDAFKAGHAEVPKIANKAVHLLMAGAYQEATRPAHPRQEANLNLIKNAIGERISIARGMESRRGDDRNAGNEAAKGENSGS